MSMLPSMKQDDVAFSPWPNVDTLYDYLAFLQDDIATLPKQKWGSEVAVIGAGAAGLVAAYELLKIGLKPVVFEASNRIGGRLYSKHFHDKDGKPVSAFAELGAMRIPESSRVFFHYAELFGLDYNALFPDPGLVDTLLYYQNDSYWWKANESVPDAFSVVDENWRHFVKPLAEKIHRPWREGDFEAVSRTWQHYIEHYKGRSFYEVIRSESAAWFDEDLDRFGALGIGTGGFGPLYHIGFLEILRVIIHEWEEQQKLISEGVETLTDRLYEHQVKTPMGDLSLKDIDAVKLNTPISWISCRDGNPTLRYIDPETQQEVRAQYPAIIVATTTRSMQMMGLTIPPKDRADLLSTNQKTAVRNLHHINASKMFIRTKTKFWKNTNLPLNIQTDELPRGVYLLDYPQTENGVVCMSYTWGDDSIKLIGLSPEERFYIIRESINRILPELGQHLIPLNDEIIQIDWEAEPYYYGAFKLHLPGQENDTSELYYQFLSALSPDDRGVYLAGDSVSWSGGWVEGALHTGINAATAVAKRLGAFVPEDSPLSQNPNRYNYQ